MHHHKDKKSPCTLVLLVNLGSPAAATPSAVRRYLGEFLWDRRVVEVPRIIWWCILHLIILPLRAPRVARLYAAIFTRQGAPLVATTAAIAQRLQTKLASSKKTDNLIVDYAMRYGTPSMADQLGQYQQQPLQRLLVLPLYPQYAACTVGTAFDNLARVLRNWRWVPDIRFINSYYDRIAHIDALARHIQHHRKPDHHLIISFHGIPLSMSIKGDPYYCHCHKTARVLAAYLELDESQWRMTFQSRFGRQPWLQPYTDKTLETLPTEQQIKKVQVVCPGFAVDCLETLEEIMVENRDAFLAAGGESYQYIPCLNDSQLQIDALAGLITEQLATWQQIDRQRIEAIPDSKQSARYARAASLLGKKAIQ